MIFGDFHNMSATFSVGNYIKIHYFSQNIVQHLIFGGCAASYETEWRLLNLNIQHSSIKIAI